MLRTQGWWTNGSTTCTHRWPQWRGQERPGLTEPIPRVCVAAESVPRGTHTKCDPLRIETARRRLVTGWVVQRCLLSTPLWHASTTLVSTPAVRRLQDNLAG